MEEKRVFFLYPPNLLFITTPATETNTGGKALAFCGQFDIQRIQVIHFLLSVQFGLLNGIALTGHSLAHLLLFESFQLH